MRIETKDLLNKTMLVPIGLLLLLFLIPVNPNGIQVANADASCIEDMNGATGQVGGDCKPSDLSATCLAAYNSGGSLSSACTGSDWNILNVIGANPLGVNTAQQNAIAQAAGTLAICSSSFFSWSAFFDPNCWGPLLSGVIGGVLVSVASWVLVVSGFLFNWALAETVTQFGTFVNGNVIGAITTAWDAFRDISNIVIIGMFTFIAIMTILGSTDYGAKKMISRVLIVAILINFSLLFTKIIIDASNFTASQFASAASGAISQTANETASGSANSTTVTATASNGATGQVAQVTSQPAGIAGAFMQYAGLQGFGDTGQAVFNLSKTQGSWTGLLYGMVTALFFLVASVVLLYGAFLLISRAILMIFLMITSSLAFASYLVPTLSQNYGWNAWWSALLKNAVFAPLLMVLLWVTLTVGSKFNVTAANSGQAATLGQLITNPQATLDINALFGYLIVFGLLFASMRIASSFSSQIGGFNWAQAAVSTPLAAINRYGIAPTLRRLPIPFVGGRGSAARAQSLGAEIKDEAKKQAARPKGERDFSQLTSLIRKKESAEKRAKSTFDVVNTRPGQAIAKAVKVPGPLIAKTKTNFADTAEAKAKTASKAAEEVAVSKNDAEKMARDEAASNADTASKDNAKKALDANEKILKQLKENGEKQKSDEGLDDKMKKATEKLDTEKDDVSKMRLAAQQEFDGSKKTPGDEQKRKVRFSEQDDRIKNATATVQAIQGRIDAIDKPHKDIEKVNSQLEKNIKELDKKIEAGITKRANEIRADSIKNAQEVGVKLTQNTVQKLFNLPPDKVAAEKARNMVGKKLKLKEKKELHDAESAELKEIFGDDHGGGGGAGGANSGGGTTH